MLSALLKELELRSEYFGSGEVGTIYFGGGTPSLLETADIQSLLEKINTLFNVSANAEITFEANPDDITDQKLTQWKKAGINRLSIGVQSFFDEDLRWMNRAHSASQSVGSLQSAIRQFENITIDLIYGTPLLTHDKWKQNVDTAIRLNIPHLSCYALTVEPKTPLQKMISLGKMQDINPDNQSEQFLLLMQWTEDAGYEHYEISNFAKPGFRSRHNSSYWQGKKYLGIGPSAHSFDGSIRQWNISNNMQYVASIEKGIVPFEKEELTATQQLNEYIMTSLRTAEGIDLTKLDDLTRKKLHTSGKKYIEAGLMKIHNGSIILTKQGKLLADGIAADLFL